MLPLDHFKHTSNSGTIQASNSFHCYEWASHMIGMTKCTKQVLSKRWMACQPTLPCFARRRGMSYNGGCINTYWRSQVCLIHSLACKTSSHQVAWWRYWQVDLRCHTLNANVPFLLVISYEMMADINMLCSWVLNRVVGELDGTLIVAKQWHFFWTWF